MTRASGRTVLFVLRDTQHRPAVITRLLSGDRVNLQIFGDGPNDNAQSLTWRGGVDYSEAKEPGTWHWPEEDGFRVAGGGDREGQGR